LKRAFVDTGAWYALLDKNDPDHVPVAETSRAYRGRLITSDFVFDERNVSMKMRHRGVEVSVTREAPRGRLWSRLGG
jgi:predicted nucleic acid-binding protein